MPIDFANPMGWPMLQPSNTLSLFDWHAAVAVGAMLCHSALTDDGLEPRRPVDADDIHALREHFCAVLRAELLATVAGARPPGWINDNPYTVCNEECEETDPVPINVDPEDGDCEFLARWRLMSVADDGRLRFELQTALTYAGVWECLADLNVQSFILYRTADYSTMINNAFDDYVLQLRSVRLATLLVRAQQWCRLHDMPAEEDLLAYTSAFVQANRAGMLRDICTAVTSWDTTLKHKYESTR